MTKNNRTIIDRNGTLMSGTYQETWEPYSILLNADLTHICRQKHEN